MELNRQGLSLIEYLYDNGGQIQMSQICKYLSLSKRSLLYQVDKMNDFLRENQLSEIVSTGQRIMLSVEEQKKVEKILFSQEIKNHVASLAMIARIHSHFTEKILHIRHNYR